MSRIIKSTTLEGYYATGDMGTFCFDLYPTPNANTKERVYPEHLIPKGTDGKRGRWTITVEFEPFEETPKN